MIKEVTMHKYIEDYFSEYKFKHEVKFFKKKVDFVFIDENEDLHAIELKVKDWKNSLSQIDTNQLFANFCYLGIWNPYSSLVEKKLFKKYGIGILSIDKNNVDLILKPKKSPILNKKYMTLIKQSVNECYK